jgi:hypothetical protein
MSIAVATTNGFPIPDSSANAFTGRVKLVHRRISSQAGHALEILGHSIEYLIDEADSEGKPFEESDPRCQAGRMLMAINREIYFECPEVPSFLETWHSFLRTHGAWPMAGTAASIAERPHGLKWPLHAGPIGDLPARGRSRDSLNLQILPTKT